MRCRSYLSWTGEGTRGKPIADVRRTGRAELPLFDRPWPRYRLVRFDGRLGERLKRGRLWRTVARVAGAAVATRCRIPDSTVG